MFRMGWSDVRLRDSCAAMIIKKEALPRGHSYALKPSTLESALHAAGVTTHRWLDQLRGRMTQGRETLHIFDAEFWPPHPGRPYEALAMRSWAIPSEHRPEARAYIERVMLPEFISWICGIEALPTDSPTRRKEQRFSRDWKPSASGDATGPVRTS